MCAEFGNIWQQRAKYGRLNLTEKPLALCSEKRNLADPTGFEPVTSAFGELSSMISL